MYSTLSPEFIFAQYSMGPVSLVQSGTSHLEDDEKLAKMCPKYGRLKLGGKQQLLTR